MFSGGRDSTIAALRLGRIYPSLVLVTVSTEHLLGINHVTTRLWELKRHLPLATRWYHFSFEGDTERGAEFFQTCLPCHAVYLLAGLTVAAQNTIRDVAFGYTDYQSAWAEQTPEGRAAIFDLSASFGCRAIFPVSDLASKEDAIRELRGHGISERALEQKCLRQQGNEVVNRDSLVAEIKRWAGDLKQALELELPRKLRLVRSLALSDIEEPKQCLPII